MTERVALLNGKNINQDYDLSKVLGSLANPGVVTGLAVTTNQVSAGYGFIEVTRGSETFNVLYENTANIIIDTTGTKKVWVAISQAKVDDGSANALDGTGIGSIETGVSYPTNNYIPLASISAGVITDERSFISLKGVKRKGLGNYKVIYTSATGVETELPLGAINTFLKSNGETSLPTFDMPIVASATETSEGIVERATNLEASTGTDITRYITPKQAKDNYVSKLAIIPIDVALTNLVEEWAYNIAYTKYKEAVIPVTGTYLIKTSQKFDGSGSTWTGWVRVYKNGSPYGTEFSATTTTSTLPLVYQEVLSFTAGDLIQLYSKQNNGAGWSVNMNLYGTYGSLPAVTINNP